MPAEADGPDLAQVVVLGGLGVLAGGSLLVLATGAVAGLLFGAGLPDMRLSEASSVLAALPGAWADPRMAWPLPVREGLPGPEAFYVSLALVLAASVGVLAIARRVAPLLRSGWATRDDAVAAPGRFGRPGRGPVRRKRVGPESTAFATRRDTDDLVVAGPRRGGSS